jgi:hypothetical protein
VRSPKRPASSSPCDLVGRVGLALALILVGCKGKSTASPDARPPAVQADAGPPPARIAPVVQVRDIVVDDLGWIEVVPRPTDAVILSTVKAALGHQLAADGVPGRLRVRVGAAHGRAGSLLCAVALELSWKEGGVTEKLEARVVGEKTPADGAPMGQVAQETLTRALGDAVAVLVKRDGIRRGQLAAVLASLDDQDPEVRADGFRAIAERQLHEATPRLIELLSVDEEDRRDGALGALVALREQRAVGAIVGHVEFNDIDSMRRVIDAVAQIGGEEAESYLELVAGGHELPGVRGLAAEALARLRARKRP